MEPTAGPDDGPTGFDEMPATEARSSSAPPSTIDRKGIQAAIEAGVHLATAEANRSLTRDELEREAGVFLAEPDEATQLARPLSQVVARHAPAGAAGNPDLADLIAALLVIAGYFSRTIRLRRELKRAMAEGRVTYDPAGGVRIAPRAPQPTEAAA